MATFHTTRAAIEGFVSQKTLALVGASRSGKGFGHALLKELVKKGAKVFPVHPEATEIAGLKCYRTLAEVPEGVGGVVVVVPPEEAVGVVRDAIAARIPRVWLQQGAESPEAVSLAEQAGVQVVAGRCLLMFAEPVQGWAHRFHRWLLKVTKRLPA